ncbi:MAG: GHMP family kinase ATP-binding protein [Gammaproteobacteria bacterium]
MIISRTPYRISFFGGGTDYHTWYQENGAAIFSTTINRYCYLHCRRLAPFFSHKSRIVWSKVEDVIAHQEIEHPSVRAVLEYLNITGGIEIHYLGDLPARSGLGSSSSFTVGLLNALYALNGLMSSKRELACEAIHVERNILKENVGIQDQIAAAYGGLNKIQIQMDGQFEVSPVILPDKRMKDLQDHLLMFFTGISRTASDIAGEKIKSIPQKKAELSAMQQMVDEAIRIVREDQDITNFGHLLHESWMLKRQISPSISSTLIDDIYLKARNAGALGGKLLGAGGGGFILFFVKPEDKIKVCEALKDLLLVPFAFENSGSQIIFYEQMNYTLMSLERRDYIHLRDQENHAQHQNDEENLQARPRLNHLMEIDELNAK